MANYRRIPNEVDAFCYGLEETPRWFRELIEKGTAIPAGGPDHLGSWCRIKTLDGERVGFHGQWFVRDGTGDISFWEHGFFVKSFEPITQ